MDGRRVAWSGHRRPSPGVPPTRPQVGMHNDAAYEALADSVVQEAEALGTAGGPDFE